MAHNYQFDGFRFDPADGRLGDRHGELVVTLRPQVGRLLLTFLDHPDEVIDRDRLCNAVWAEGTVVDFDAGLAALIRELRQALDQVGAGAGLIETAPRRGYRFLGKVESVAAPPPADVDRWKKPWLIPLAVILLLIVAGLVAWMLQPERPSEGKAAPTIAILPFEIYVAEGEPDRRLQLLMADTVLARLWDVALPELVLIGRATLRPYHDREDLAAAVAQDLGVDLLLEGFITLEQPDVWRVDARLLFMPQGVVRWSGSVTWENQQILPVGETADQLVQNLAEAWPRVREEMISE